MAKIKCRICKNKIENIGDYANGTKFQCNKCGQYYFFGFKIGDKVFTVKGDNQKDPGYGGKVIGFGFWRDFNGINILKTDGYKHQFLEKNLRLME